MAYTTPSVGPAGLTINSFTDILDFYLAGFQAIYGNTVYLGNDSADYQLLANIALTAADCNSALQLAYNQQSPVTAVGGGLSTIVAVSGLQRAAATFSTCLVTLTGTAGAIITNGVIQNATTGDLWNLASTVTIGSGGTVTVIATAQVAGVINALANQLTIIVNPQPGWVSVSNGSNVATLGTAVETDSQLRARQTLSTELPSLSLPAGTIAAVLAVPGVTRINNNPSLGANGTPSIENFTGGTDSWGNPAHSLTVVVQGGTAAAVAQAIYNNRGIGVLTNGDVSGSSVAGTQTVDVTDPNSGITIPISFIQPPTLITIYVIVNAHVIAGGSLTAAQVLAIQNGIINYLNGLPIGGVISFGEMVQSAALAVNTNPEQPIISIRSPFYFATTPSPSTSADITLPFYQAAQSSTANILVNSV